MYTNPNPKPSAITVKYGQRWPRLMELEAAAAYAAQNLGTFKERPELAGLIKPYFGIPSVDKVDLDAMIDAEKERIKQEGN